jgi:hypothetical protein
MVTKNKIIVLITYFGNFPWYFPYFLHSVKFNRSIDFIIFSDSSYEGDLPSNVRIVNKDLDEIRILASKKLGLRVSIDYPYKLCDFKPAYGLIFEDYTEGYDFWAQSDIDLIFGDLRSLLNSKILNTYDFVSMRHDYATGCFTLFRNNSLMNYFFKRSRAHEKAFTTSSYLGFDELNFKHCELSEGKTLAEIDTQIECFTHIIRHAAECGEIKALFDFMLIEGLPGKIKFNNGQLIYNGKYEAALYHLYWLKKIYKPEQIPKRIPNTFYISPTKIYFK